MQQFSWHLAGASLQDQQILAGMSRRGRQRLLREALAKRNIVGLVPGGDGTNPATGRQGKTGESIIAQAGGKWYEPASRGMIFGAADQGVGVVITVALSTTAILSLHNPLKSKFRLEVMIVRLSYFSGTFPAGSFYHCILPPGSTLPTGGTALTATMSDVGNSSAAAAVGVAISAPTVVSPTVYGPAFTTGAFLASTTNGIQLGKEDMDGEIVLEPGAQYQLQCVGAGSSSPKGSVGISWLEVPYTASVG